MKKKHPMNNLTKKDIIFFRLLFFALIGLIVGTFFYGCNVDVNHDGEIRVIVAIDDSCFACFPKCDVGDNPLTLDTTETDHEHFFCYSEDSDVDCSECAVGCISAVGQTCENSMDSFNGYRVNCFNNFTGQEFDVPSLCVRKNTLPDDEVDFGAVISNPF